MLKLFLIAGAIIRELNRRNHQHIPSRSMGEDEGGVNDLKSSSKSVAFQSQ